MRGGQEGHQWLGEKGDGTAETTNRGGAPSFFSCGDGSTRRDMKLGPEEGKEEEYSTNQQRGKGILLGHTGAEDPRPGARRVSLLKGDRMLSGEGETRCLK